MNLILILLTASFALTEGIADKIEDKLKAKDYPTGKNINEFKEDKEPHLSDLMEEASVNKKKELLPTVTKIIKNKNIFWEVRQEAVYFVCYFSEDPKALSLLKQVVADRNEPVELKENAYTCISTSKLPEPKKMEMAESFLKSKDLDANLKLQLAKDLSAWGNNDKAKKVVDEVLSLSDLEKGPRAKAEDLKKTLNK